jgi:hypothetical protein
MVAILCHWAGYIIKRSQVREKKGKKERKGFIPFFLG